MQNTDGSNKSKGYLYTDDQGKLLVGQKDEDSVNYEVGVALVKFAGAHPTRMQIMEYTSKLGAEKYPSGSDKTHDFSAINLRMSGWFSSQLYIRICGKLGIDPDFHGKNRMNWYDASDEVGEFFSGQFNPQNNATALLSFRTISSRSARYQGSWRKRTSTR